MTRDFIGREAPTQPCAVGVGLPFLGLSQSDHIENQIFRCFSEGRLQTILEKKYNNKKKEGWGSANTDDGKFGPRSHLYQPKAWPPSGPVQRTIKLSDHMRHQNCTNWFLRSPQPIQASWEFVENGYNCQNKRGILTLGFYTVGVVTKIAICYSLSFIEANSSKNLRPTNSNRWSPVDSSTLRKQCCLYLFLTVVQRFAVWCSVV